MQNFNSVWCSMADFSGGKSGYNICPPLEQAEKVFPFRLTTICHLLRWLAGQIWKQPRMQHILPIGPFFLLFTSYKNQSLYLDFLLQISYNCQRGINSASHERWHSTHNVSVPLFQMFSNALQQSDNSSFLPLFYTKAIREKGQ